MNKIILLALCAATSIGSSAHASSMADFDGTITEKLVNYFNKNTSQNWQVLSEANFKANQDHKFGMHFEFLDELETCTVYLQDLSSREAYLILQRSMSIVAAYDLMAKAGVVEPDTNTIAKYQEKARGIFKTANLFPDWKRETVSIDDSYYETSSMVPDVNGNDRNNNNNFDFLPN